jgi:hypothetical protein
LSTSLSIGAASCCLLLLLLAGCAGKAIVDDGSSTGGNGAKASSGSAGAGLCVDCASFMHAYLGYPVCPGPEHDAYEALLACGCSGGCPECTNYPGQQFCIGGFAGGSCLNCMALLCPEDYVACEGEIE